MIDWTAFDWSNFCTLAAGGGAVTAACVVGWKQAGIAERQVAINERQVAINDRQTKIQHETLRQNLFDRRLVIYRCALSALNEVNFSSISASRYREFEQAVEESVFLFPVEIVQFLSSALDTIDELLSTKSMRTEDEIDALKKKSLKNYASLAVVFKDMRLSDRLDR